MLIASPWRLLSLGRQRAFRGATMNFWQAIKSGFSQLRHFLGPGDPVGILVLGSVHAARRHWRRKSSMLVFSRTAYRRHRRSTASSISLHLPAEPRAIGPPAARHRPHRLVGPDRFYAHRHFRADLLGVQTKARRVRTGSARSVRRRRTGHPAPSSLIASSRANR